MKLAFVFVQLWFGIFAASTQGNFVFSGGELANYAIVDISAVNGISWATERYAVPGYFSVLDTANYIGCTDSANINGYIKKYGNKAFIFPVGSGNDIRTLEISAPAVSTDAYATAWIVGNPNTNRDPTLPYAGFHTIYSYGAPLVAISPAGQWDWQVGYGGYLGTGTTGSGAGLTITVSIPDMTSFSQANHLRLVGWNGARWIDLSNKATASGNTENSTLSGKMIAEISAIAIGRVASSLAIKLENFYAISSNCNAVLNWNTFNEINTEVFIVEQSLDATHFFPITSVNVSGLTNANTYSITISQPEGLAYYRLKMIEIDGSFSYSPIISCRNTCNLNEYLFVYPNPVSTYENININITTNYKGSAELIILNSIGQKVLSADIHLTAGSNLISPDIIYLSTGTYFIRILNEDGKQIGSWHKFIRQ